MSKILSFGKDSMHLTFIEPFLQMVIFSGCQRPSAPHDIYSCCTKCILWIDIIWQFAWNNVSLRFNNYSIPRTCLIQYLYSSVGAKQLLTTKIWSYFHNIFEIWHSFWRMDSYLCSNLWKINFRNENIWEKLWHKRYTSYVYSTMLFNFWNIVIYKDIFDYICTFEKVLKRKYSSIKEQFNPNFFFFSQPDFKPNPERERERERERTLNKHFKMKGKTLKHW